MAQVEDHLPSRCEALSSSFSTGKKKVCCKKSVHAIIEAEIVSL